MKHTHRQYGLRLSLALVFLCVSPVLATRAYAGDSDNLPFINPVTTTNDVKTAVNALNADDRTISEDDITPIHPWDNNDFTDTSGANGAGPKERRFRDDPGADRQTEAPFLNKVTQPEDIGELTNYPNPFNAQTNIRFTLNVDTDVELRIFNLLGQSVRDVKLNSLSAGEHSWTWDGRAGDGQTAPSGIYFYRVISGRSSAIGKMVLLK